MYGENPIRPPVKGDGQTLEIQEIFATLQGEGPYVGWPAVFVRLGGCNLACDFCDTEFESFNEMDLHDVVSSVTDKGRHIRLVVITGGEPLRQNIAPLCIQLISMGYLVQIETNGTLFRDLPEEVEIICSPKVSNGTYHDIREDLLSRITAFKFIISGSHPDYHHIPEVGQRDYDTPVYVQPMDEYDEAKNAANQKLALDLALKHGYRLSLQTHKLLGIA